MKHPTKTRLIWTITAILAAVAVVAAVRGLSDGLRAGGIIAVIGAIEWLRFFLWSAFEARVTRRDDAQHVRRIRRLRP